MDKNSKYLKEQILRMSGSDVTKCMRCGKCSATCPSYENMEYHPHQFVYMIENGDIEPLMKSESVYRCLSCYACAQRCPRGVEPSKLIEAVRALAVGEQGKNRISAETIAENNDVDLPQQAIVSAFRKYSR